MGERKVGVYSTSVEDHCWIYSFMRQWTIDDVLLEVSYRRISAAEARPSLDPEFAKVVLFCHAGSGRVDFTEGVYKHVVRDAKKFGTLSEVYV